MSLAFASVVARDPESRLLNMREKAAVRDAHVPDIYRNATGTGYAGRCSCRVSFLPSLNAHDLHDAHQAHVTDELERAKAWKVAEAKARAVLRDLDASIDAALEYGYRAARGELEPRATHPTVDLPAQMQGPRLPTTYNPAAGAL